MEAGADLVETNTFGGTPLVLAEYGLADRAHDINLAAAHLARQAAARHQQPGRPRFVAGAMGPTTKTLSVTGGVRFDEMATAYRVQARGLIEGGVDVLLIETCLDTLNAKAAIAGARAAFRETGLELPIMLSCTIEQSGTMLGGQGVEAFFTSTEHAHPLGVGMNCSTGPEFMTEHLRALSELAWCFVSCYPNAGLPDENGQFAETPTAFAAKLERFVEQGWLNLVGGCCGTHAGHIKEVARLVEGRAPRRPRQERRLALSGTDFYQPDPATRPVLVGERTNSLGSKKFRTLLAGGRFEEASEVGRQQVRGGAQVLDICLQNPDRDELFDMEQFLRYAVRKVPVPLMFDSTDAAVIELALERCQGKSIVNSINLEDGEERFARVCPLLREYGAAVVVGCIDEDPKQGMAVTAQRKLDIARRSHELLTGKYGLEARNLIFDPLTFPAGTGDANYVGSAVQTIEGVRRIKEAFPDCSTVLGISNVSFGLPEAGREVLNSVFLYHCTKAGLDFAIVNSEKIERYASIPEAERLAAEDLLFDRRPDAVAAFAELFRDRKKSGKKKPHEFAGLTLEQRISRRIVEGTREGLLADLDLALRQYTPLQIINGPLMAGMDEVGRLFAASQLIVSEVLQSAEAMKASVSHLEPHMKKEAAAAKGRIVLATVKGDVHDIGKNLVEIILSNNGYEIVNLGIKVPSEVLIQACRQHRPDAVGLSGLLVKSAQQMVATASDLRAAGIDCPLLVGGAALTRKFTATRIAAEYRPAPVLYSKDAMEGLDLLNQLLDPARRPALLERVRSEQAELATAGPAPVDRSEPVAVAGSPLPPPSAVSHDVELPPPPDLERHVALAHPLADIARFLNPQMLYGKHLGLKGPVATLLASGDPRALELKALIDGLLETCASEGWMQARAVWQFFRAAGDGDDLVLFSADGGQEVERFRFPRQPTGERLCLADFAAPLASGRPDHVALFVTSTGAGIRERVERLKLAGEYLRCHALQALALEMAEAFAELLHARLRETWGFPDPAALTMAQRFQKHYRGVRVSFGYPACPRLEDQAKLFGLLAPADLGVVLTEGFMMDPEASVSALVFHHPAARYFNAGA
ncbi:MAG: methionine synthase [Candidatus Riflebacteria bacterium]|nr:methionine synthase [Candidatus Riflebacteria bacterium]